MFISYSRKDTPFVERLRDALVDSSREVWVDVEGIPPSAEWRREIAAAIESALAFAFVISPDSLVSAECRDELAHAIRHHKRLLPLLCRQVDDQPVPDALA